MDPSPQVLVFPIPYQGHVNSMLKLAELLSLSNLHVTFLLTENSYHQLTQHSDVQHRFARFPGFQFRTVADGLPASHPRTFDYILEIVESMKAVSKPILREMMISGHLGLNLSCVILDGFFNFLIDAFDGVGIPIFCFRTISACAFWAYTCVPDLIQNAQLPIKGKEDMDRMIEAVPGMENLLRCRDLPSVCRTKTPINDPLLQLIINQTFQNLKTHALIFNSFEDLEAPILSKIRTLCPNIYVIGPLHTHLHTHHQKPTFNSPSSESEPATPNSLWWEVDETCLAWLDSQPPNSVLYISFGSITVMGHHELMEFWHGLVNSEMRFLWVIRPDLVTGENGDFEIPAEVEEGTRKRGYMVKWVPQEKVLAHEAVGGFLTHGGWNSTLESISAGKPMICWSYVADQQVNSRFISHVWKLGVDMKDVCERETVARMVNDVMVNRREEFMSCAAKMRDLARKSVHPGGSSYVDFDRLVQDIKLMTQRKTESTENCSRFYEELKKN